MSKALATTAPIKPPKELQSFLDNPPLVGNELPEEYEAVFMAIANALKPTDFIVWQCAERLTDLAWYIRRERILKNEIIKLYHKEIVSELLAGMFNNPMLGAKMQKKAQVLGRRRADVRFAAMHFVTAWQLTSRSIRISTARSKRWRRLSYPLLLKRPP
jgi:hypothetical protein